MSHLLAFQDAIASTSSHSSNVEKFCAVDHVVVYQSVRLSSSPGEQLLMTPQRRTRDQRTFPSGDTDAFRLNLKTEAALVFPQSRSHPRLHPRRGDLTGTIKGRLRVTLSVPTRSVDEAVRRWSTCRDCYTRNSQYANDGSNIDRAYRVKVTAGREPESP